MTPDATLCCLKTYLTDDISKEALLDIFSHIYALHQPGEFLD